jgi:hypothetical protein
MSNVATLISPNGRKIPTAGIGMEPPNNSPYFGWTDVNGPSTVAVESIMAIVPQSLHPEQAKQMNMQPGPTGRFILVMKTDNRPMFLEPDDARRLMKRLGWKETSAIEKS